MSPLAWLIWGLIVLNVAMWSGLPFGFAASAVGTGIIVRIIFDRWRKADEE